MNFTALYIQGGKMHDILLRIWLLLISIFNAQCVNQSFLCVLRVHGKQQHIYQLKIDTQSIEKLYTINWKLIHE